MKKRGLFLLFLFIFLLNNLYAEFNLGDQEFYIETSYSPGANIKGWINISFTNQDASIEFQDSFNNDIALIDLIEETSSYEYNCTTTQCTDDYTASNGETTKSFTLNLGDEQDFGIRFNKNLNSIESIEFDIESNAEASCTNQILVDILADDFIDAGNYLISPFTCPFLKNYGCYNETEETNEYQLGKYPNKHCQKILLSKSPGYKLGAWVNRAEDTRELTMALYNLNGAEIEDAYCYLPDGNQTGEISCEIDYLLTEEEEYYVCIYAEEEGTSKIKGSSTGEKCGFYSSGFSASPAAAFQIFAEGRKFESLDGTTITINNTLSNGNNLNILAADYIWDNYGSLDCTEQDCIVPLRFISDKNQDITLKNFKIKYTESGLGPVTETKIYDIEKVPAQINSNYQLLYLNNSGFTVPIDYGTKTYKVELGEEELFSEVIEIEYGPEIKYLSPTETFSAYPTTFEIITDSYPQGISNYLWNFGDNKTETTKVNKVIHTYNQTGSYNLRIEIQGSDGKSSYKTFNILVETPQEKINSTLIKLQQTIEKITKDIEELDDFSKNTLIEILNLEELSDELVQLEREFKAAEIEEEFNSIMDQLVKIKIPESLTIQDKSEALTFYPSSENINLDIIKQIDESEYPASQKDMYIDTILQWNQKYLDTKISFRKFVAKYPNGDVGRLNLYELNISEKELLQSQAYLFLKKIEDLRLKENYLESEIEDYYMINVMDGENIIAFSTVEDIAFGDLPIFISPSLDRLEITQIESIPESETDFKWVWFSLIIILLIIVGVIVYIILQEWYKKKYENYLFKNKNNLYNLISYIENSKKKNLSEKEIVTALKKVGWKSEQIDYVLKKYAGKKTGMAEIPIWNILEKIKIKKAKESPQPTPPKMNFPQGQRPQIPLTRPRLPNNFNNFQKKF